MRTAPREQGSKSITAFLVERDFKGFHYGTEARQAGHARVQHLRTGVRGLRHPRCQRARRGGRGRLHTDERPGFRTTGAVAAAPSASCRPAWTSRCLISTSASSSTSPSAASGSCRARSPTCITALQSSRAFAYRTAEQFDRGVPTRQDAAACLLLAAQSAVHVALEAIQSLGGNGYINEYPTGRLLRDAKLYEIGAGTSEIRRMLIGRELLAASASN